MSFQDWQTAVLPKVQGTWNLHHASIGLDLDFFLLFSSWSGLVGQWGQANYAAVSLPPQPFRSIRRLTNPFPREMLSLIHLYNIEDNKASRPRLWKLA